MTNELRNRADKAVQTGLLSDVSLIQLLGLLFIGLKLTGEIDWSWWLVLLPIYSSVLLPLAMWAVVVVALASKRTGRER